MRFQNSHYESRWTMYIHVMYTPCTIYVMYIQCTTLHASCSYSSEQYEICSDMYMTCSDMYIYWHKFVLMHIHVYTWPNNVYSMCMSSMYNFMCLWTQNQKVKICYGLSSNPWPCACRMIALTTALLAFMNCCPLCQYISTVVPGGWWRTSGAGPAAPPAPAMTSPAQVST